VTIRPAFVLHSYAWRETSLIVEVLRPGLRQDALVARGANARTSQFRGNPDAVLAAGLSWSGRSSSSRWCARSGKADLRRCGGDGLLAAFYLNEFDGAPAAARDAIRRCSGPTCSHWPRLAASTAITIGFCAALSWTCCAIWGRTVVPDLRRRRADRSGPLVLCRSSTRSAAQPRFERSGRLPGLTVLALARRDLSDPSTLAAARPFCDD